MQYQIPQYMEAPDSIIGPFTLKQFGYLVVAGIITFITYYTLYWIIWLFLSATSVGVALAFAFVKIHGRTFDQITVSAIKFMLQPKLYIWQRRPQEKEFSIEEAKGNVETVKTRVSAQNLIKDLSEKLITAKMPIPNKERFVQIQNATGEKEFAKKVDFK